MTHAIVGEIPTLYDSNGPLSALDGADDLLLECEFDFVQLHTGEPGLSAARLRALLPRVQILVGIGVDATARAVASGERSVSWGISHLVALAQRAVDVGAIVLVLNAEGSWKTAPNSTQRTRLREVVREGLDAIDASFPTLPLWHTSYDHPTWHSTYNWSDWIGAQSPVVVSLPQVYAAGNDLVQAHRGALPKREARALASWAAAVRAGWIDADVPDGTPGDETDVDWRPYYQLHHVPTVDTITGALQHPFAALWALPTRADRAGRNALRALCALRRAGAWLPGLETFRGRMVSTAVRDRQDQLGVESDGNYGPKTAKADGIAWEP